MAYEGNLKIINSCYNMPECDEDYDEEIFSTFLTSTRENLAKLAVDDKENTSVSVDNGDMEFMTFLGQLKSELSIKSDECDSLPLVKCASFCQSPRLKSVSSPSIEESPSNQTDIKRRSFTTSSLHKMLKLEDDWLKHFSYYRVALAEKLYKLFNEKIFENKLPLDMEIEWSVNLRSTAGKTIGRCKGDVFSSCKIQLASKILTNFERLRDTLLHEMCHAAVMMISQKREEHHGALWKLWAARSNIIFPDIKIPTRCHNYEISYPYYYHCESCKMRWGRQKKSTKFANAVCPQCKIRLSLKKS